MAQVLWVGDTMLDEGARRVERDRYPVDLTRKEFELLAQMMRNRGLVQERDALLESVWGSTSYNPNVIEVTVSSLRRKLERHGPRIVHTIRGIGYVCRAEQFSDLDLRSTSAAEVPGEHLRAHAVLDRSTGGTTFGTAASSPARRPDPPDG